MHERYLVCSVARFGVGSNAGMIWVPATMPAPGHLRKSVSVFARSDLPPTADIERPLRHVRLAPLTEVTKPWSEATPCGRVSTSSCAPGRDGIVESFTERHWLKAFPAAIEQLSLLTDDEKMYSFRPSMEVPAK
jgi:hypothetical protein